MDASVVNQQIRLCVGRVITARACVGNTGVRIVSEFTGLLLWMIRGKVLKVTRLLNKPRVALTLLTLVGKILQMILLHMIVHGVLLFRNLVTMRADKVSVVIASVLQSGLGHPRVRAFISTASRSIFCAPGATR